MPGVIDPVLFDGLSVYQDVVLAGETVRKGVRDCEQRWRLIEPYLPPAGTVVDIGSNFGWFGLKICESRPDCVVASVEADPRSALIQRKVLESHEHRRIALLTASANCRMLARFAAAGQRFDAALCLSILHWLPDHRRFLTRLGEMTDRIVLDYPHAGEIEAGNERIRQEIGDIEVYLGELFAGRPLHKIGGCPSHLDPARRRSVWLVDSTETAPRSSAGLCVSALIDNGLSWPPRGWWMRECARLADAPDPPGTDWTLRASGLCGGIDRLRGMNRRVKHLPETTLYSGRDRVGRQMWQAAGRMIRRGTRWMADTLPATMR